VAASGCGGTPGGSADAVGGEEQSRQTEAQTEAIYLVVGGLKYQVQLSRILNPADVEDRQYLTGLPASTKRLDRDETWFAIFMRVENDSEVPATSTDRFEIVDTDRNRYRPVRLDPAVNPFAYTGRALEPGDLQPSPDSAAGQGPIQGELLLFRIAISTLQNRPVQLRFRDPSSPEVGVVELDV
jgi:hypothetical protein